MITWTIVGIIAAITALFAPITKYFSIHAKIKKNWGAIKCTPLGTMLHPLIGPKNVSSTQNQTKCEGGKFASMLGPHMAPHLANIANISHITGKITGDIQNVRKKIFSMEQSVLHTLSDSYNKIYSAYGRIAQMFVTIISVVQKILHLLTALLCVASNAFYTLGSTWNGPIGGVGRYFA